MIFTQNFSTNGNVTNSEIRKICETHVGCVGCPLKENDKTINGNIVRCETGRQNG